MTYPSNQSHQMPARLSGWDSCSVDERREIYSVSGDAITHSFVIEASKPISSGAVALTVRTTVNAFIFDWYRAEARVKHPDESEVHLSQYAAIAIVTRLMREALDADIRQGITSDTADCSLQEP